MVSGTDDQLRRQWTRPGQTLRAPVNRRARDPPEVTPKTSCQPIAESCAASNIIVRMTHWWNYRYCATSGESRQRRSRRTDRYVAAVFVRSTPTACLVFEHRTSLVPQTLVLCGRCSMPAHQWPEECAMSKTQTQSQPAGLQAAFARDAGTLSDKFTGLARVMSGK